MEWKKWLSVTKSGSASDNIWLDGSASPATITVFEREDAASGLLDAKGRPLIRKCQTLGFVSFND